MTNFASEFGATDISEVIQSQALDLWICNHYKVLPTDDRFKRLGDEQKYMLFKAYLEQPLSDEIHKAYRQSKPTLDTTTENNLKKLGYTPEQLRRLQHEIEKAGI